MLKRLKKNKITVALSCLNIEKELSELNKLCTDDHQSQKDDILRTWGPLLNYSSYWRDLCGFNFDPPLPSLLSSHLSRSEAVNINRNMKSSSLLSIHIFTPCADEAELYLNHFTLLTEIAPQGPLDLYSFPLSPRSTATHNDMMVSGNRKTGRLQPSYYLQQRQELAVRGRTRSKAANNTKKSLLSILKKWER